MTKYAWCFSHGRLHDFTDLTWCTASWVDLGPGASNLAAEHIKQEHFGDARFMRDLPLEGQETIAEQVRERETAA